jgi:hypothetical protein
MKKLEYVTPEVESMKIEYSKILCASDGNTQTPGLSDDYSDDDPA